MHRCISVPARYVSEKNANLCIESPDGETAEITLREADGRLIATADEFRRADVDRHTWLDCPESDAISVFASFLAHACETSDRDYIEQWTVNDWSLAQSWAEHMGALADNG